MSEDRSEHGRLDAVARDSWYARGLYGATARYTARVFERFWHGPRCLELGPGEGVMTEILASAFADLTMVEGSEVFCEGLRSKFPGTAVVRSLFEDYEPERPFDTIVLGHVLEHVADPVGVLRRAATWLAPGGVVCCAVPNARSLHRQAAVTMGILAAEDALNETDVHHGHRRVYNPESFRADFRAAGFDLTFFGGYWLKPLANSQIEATWTPAMIDAFMELGERYPDIAAEIVVVAALPGPAPA